MRPMIRSLLILTIGIAAFVSHGAAPAGAAARQLAQLAPNGAPGIVNAVALAQVAPDRPVAVTPFDDDDLSLAVKARFEDELRRTGRPVSESAPLTLSFETRVIEGRFSRTEGNMGRFEGGTGGLRLDLNIWSTTRDSLLGGARTGESESRQVNLLHMNAVLRDRGTGRTLWQGDAYCEMLTTDTLRIAASMVGPLVANLGQSARQWPFDIE
jgi:hypothetical protein